MRRTILILLAVAIVFLIAAIGFFIWGNGADRTETATGTVQATSTPVTVTTATLSEETADYSIDAKYPRFGIAAVDARIQGYIIAAVAELKSRAQEDEPAKNDFPQYLYSASFDSVYIGDEILSARLDTGDYTGGAHGLPHIFGVNFDRASGKELTLADALKLTGLSLEQVAARAKTTLKAEYGDNLLSIEGADAKTDNYQAFYITKDNVVFIFQPYQVTAYAAGAPEVSIPRLPAGR